MKHVISLCYSFTALILACSQSNSTENKLTVERDAELYFSLTIDTNHGNRNNDYNYMYLINDCLHVQNGDSEPNIDCREFHKINFIYGPQFDENGNFNPYQRVSLDTVSLTLSNNQLLDIYNIAKDLFAIDPSLDLHNYPEINNIDCDGAWTEVSLELRGLESVFKNSFGSCTDNPYLKRYQDLKTYLDRIGNGS